MTIKLSNVVIDCDDTLAVARFWSAALGRPLDPEPSGFFASIGRSSTEGAEAWFFAKVPEPKSAKNRMHVDLHAQDRADVEDEVGRLVGLDAVVVRAPKEEYGVYWATLQDPEGNEFCVAAP